MPRTTDATLLAAIASPYVQPALFVQLSFNVGSPPTLTPVYMWSGVGNVTYLGQTWTGIGSFLGLAVIEDGLNVQARGTAVTLSGIDATLLGDALNEYQIGAPAAVYLGFYISGSLYPTPFTSWAGKMDQVTIDVSNEEATMVIALEGSLISMNTPTELRYTPEQIQARWPGDLGGAFIDGLQEITSLWQGVANNTNNV